MLNYNDVCYVGWDLADIQASLVSTARPFIIGFEESFLSCDGKQQEQQPSLEQSQPHDLPQGDKEQEVQGLGRQMFKSGEAWLAQEVSAGTCCGRVNGSISTIQVRVRVQTIRHARIHSACKYQSCMF